MGAPHGSDTVRFAIGDQVELWRPAYGYPRGAKGVVASSVSGDSVLVRFDGTGHAVFVGTDALRHR